MIGFCKRGIPCALAGLAIAVSAATTHAAVIYEQLPDGSGDGYFSDGNQGVQFYDNRIADNFTLNSAASVAYVQWWGGSEFFASPDILLNTSAFVISFYDSSVPTEPPVYTETIPIGSITATLTGNVNLNGGLEYLFTAMLGTPVAIPASTPYSLHIGAILVAPGGDAFAWHTAVADASFSADGFDVNDGVWEPQFGDDFAFRLLDGSSDGRCCQPTGVCQVLTEGDCSTAGGTFGGLGSDCEGDPCRGRCCDANAVCTVTGPADCTGTFGGLGTGCTGNPCQAASINIDYDIGSGTPTDDYGAAGLQPGTWNNPTPNVTTPQPLLDINGDLTGATIRMTTANPAFTFDNAGTVGNDQTLMDDCLDLGGVGATDTFLIEGVGDGTYTVITYAWAPDSAAFITSVNVNGMGAQNVGGPWPGAHEEGITFAQHNDVTPIGGTITITTQTFTGFGSLNGIQLIAGGITVGRCCDLGGGCSITTEEDCIAPSVFGGTGTSCAGDPCRGRCCDPSGFCESTGPADCVAPSVFAGLGTNCSDPTICQGRCCSPDGNCELTGPANCIAPNVFGGLGSTCADISPFGNPNPPTANIPQTGAFGAALPSIISVSDNFPILDVDVRVKIQHTFRGDLILCLTAPDGSTIQLSTGAGCTSGGDCGGDDNLNAIYDDEGAPLVCASANLANLNAEPDRILPGTALATFDGMSSAGNWTLNIFDQFDGDLGVLLEWELLLDSGNACRGACCAPNGTCSITGEAPCQQANGVFQGNGTSCSPSPCAPNGACCNEALCTIQGQLDCTNAGGVWGGVGSTCTSPAPCQARCCKPDGSCDLRTIASCNAIEGGFPGTLGSACPVEPCLGRCCLANGSCSVIPVESCAGVSSPGVLNCDAVEIFQFDNVNMFMQDSPVQTPSSNIQTIETDGPLFITDLDIGLNAVHAWPGDVRFILEHEGISVIVYDQPGVPQTLFGCGTDDFNIILDDEGTGGPIEDVCNATTPSALSPPNYTPANPLAAFDGMDAAGEWTITSIDFFDGDNGTLLSWSLHVGYDGQACPTGGCTCFGDMNGDSVVDGKDIKPFANCVAAGGAGCPCGDMNHTGGATAADVTLFVNAVLTSTCGTP